MQSKRIQCRNPSGTDYRIIGKIRIEGGRTERQYYEVAAWYRDILLIPGEYWLETNGYYARWTAPGTIIEDYTPALFGGVMMGSLPQNKDRVGTVTEYTRSGYLFEILYQIIHGLVQVELLDAFEIENHDSPVLMEKVQ